MYTVCCDTNDLEKCVYFEPLTPIEQDKWDCMINVVVLIAIFDDNNRASIDGNAITVDQFRSTLCTNTPLMSEVVRIWSRCHWGIYHTSRETSWNTSGRTLSKTEFTHGGHKFLKVVKVCNQVYKGFCRNKNPLQLWFLKLSCILHFNRNLRPGLFLSQEGTK